MDEQGEKEHLLDLVSTYQKAFENGDPDLIENLSWDEGSDIFGLDDPRHAPLKARKHSDKEHAGLHTKTSWQTRFYNTLVYLVTPTLAYSTSLREINRAGQTQTSQVSFIILKKENAWRIVHAHLSSVPV